MKIRIWFMQDGKEKSQVVSIKEQNVDEYVLTNICKAAGNNYLRYETMEDVYARTLVDLCAGVTMLTKQRELLELVTEAISESRLSKEFIEATDEFFKLLEKEADKTPDE